ncbi:hypothetical protein GWK47_039275 [Chionoecetes opilio]|uniref:Uncharacterized protein n=1 Tax=Chionoecetes opilio TaxID=41210 RepID=A0A8J4YD19_CHIOP|nr:hypothetical protein GWK47_039275 [Chionoecetes opilio]
MFEGVLDGHQLSLECGAVVRRPPRQLCPTRGDERGTCSATIRVDRAVSEVYTLSRSATWAMAISACCRSSRVVHMALQAGNCVAVNSAAGAPTGAEHCRWGRGHRPPATAR